MSIELEKFKQDYDWRCAFQEVVGGGYAYVEDGDPHPIDSVTAVHHAAEGENDEEEWLAIVGWQSDDPEESFAVIAAGCDYTGWD